MFKTLIAATAAIAAFSPALATPQDAPRTSQISFDDLDLSTSAGQARLEQRIKTAARMVCDNGNSGGVRYQAAAKQCAETAQANARASVQAKLAARASAASVKTAAR